MSKPEVRRVAGLAQRSAGPAARVIALRRCSTTQRRQALRPGAARLRASTLQDQARAAPPGPAVIPARVLRGVGSCGCLEGQESHKSLLAVKDQVSQH